MKKNTYIVSVVLGLIIAFSMSVFIQTASATTTPAKVPAKVTEKMTKAKSRAAQEIDRRIEALNKLITRLGEMKKVNPTDKATLVTGLQNEIANLDALKAKINADTEIDPLKADVKSITESYRIFVLIIPQFHMLAATDRMATIIDEMSIVGAKIETRVVGAKANGIDTLKLEAQLSELKAKIDSVRNQYTVIINKVLPLVPDQGDKTVAEANKKALQEGRTTLKSGIQDLKAARVMIKTMTQELKTLVKLEAPTASTTKTH